LSGRLDLGQELPLPDLVADADQQARDAPGDQRADGGQTSVVSISMASNGKMECLPIEADLRRG
jgi:hypothetical protein